MTAIEGGCLCGTVRYVARAGTLDDPELAIADALIWTASAPGWAQLDPKLPHFKGQPPVPSTTH